MATVLVVDDRASNREMLRSVLRYRGHEVIEAHEGSEALQLAHAQHPDLVVTDVRMPGMDGYQLARELRDAPDTAGTPIVFYTANQLGDEARPLVEACGITRVLLNAGDPEQLLTALDELLRQGDGPGGRAEPGEATTREELRTVSAQLAEKEQALSVTEARFKVISDSSPIGMVFGDQHGSAVYVNVRLTEILAASAKELLGLGWLRCFDAEQEEVLAVVRGQLPSDAEFRHRSRLTLADGTTRWLNMQVQAIAESADAAGGFVATVDDVTTLVEAEQRRRATEQRRMLDVRMRADERLESLSRLAGGVAHDFNNILGAIMAYEEFVSETVRELTDDGRLEGDTGEHLLADLEQIRRGGERATGLTEQLLTFGSRRVINPTAMDLNRTVQEGRGMLAATLGDHISMAVQLAENLPSIVAEPAHVTQILVNLIDNARDAMPDGGTLTVTTGQVDVGPEESETARLAPGRYARLAVLDTGTGMAPEVLSRAVEPFFTTKERGQGSGLGLATVYGLVHQLGGALNIESAPGRGTAIVIDIPTTDQPPERPVHKPAPAGGTETILIAEDEPPIRQAVARTLARAGYTVLDAGSGPEALQRAESHSGPIQLLLTDVIMPGMLGNELADKLHEHRAETKVLFMSGYAGDLMSTQGLLQPGITALAKPFTEAELLTVVRAVLGAPVR